MSVPALKVRKDLLPSGRPAPHETLPEQLAPTGAIRNEPSNSGGHKSNAVCRHASPAGAKLNTHMPRVPLSRGLAACHISGSCPMELARMAPRVKAAEPKPSM